MIVQMIILTKSFKHHEFCIAGINVQDGRWIRLVTDNDITEGAVPYEDAQYDNGNPVEVLDCVEVDLIRHVPTQAQKENWLYNRNFVWQFIRKYTIAEVLRLHPLDITNQILGSHINYSTPQELDGCSLLLVKAVRPTISVITYQNDYSTKTKIYFNFNNNNIYYSHFSVSDISLYDYYRQKPDGTYSLGDGYAVVSLTGAWTLPGQINNIRHYKMLAQFF